MTNTVPVQVVQSAAINAVYGILSESWLIIAEKPSLIGIYVHLAAAR